MDPSFPPKANPAVWVPVPPKLPLAIIKLPPLLHDPPLYSSVAFVFVGFDPPKANVAACVPAPVKLNLAVIILPPPLQLSLDGAPS